MRAFGASEAMLAEAAEALASRRRQAGGDQCPVLPDNWLAVKAFLALEKQWRWRPDGQLVGIELTAMTAALELLGIRRREWPDVFERLQIMERAALEAMR